MFELAYHGRDGLRIPTSPTAPRQRLDDPENLPAVMLPYGGPSAHGQVWFRLALLLPTVAAADIAGYWLRTADELRSSVIEGQRQSCAPRNAGYSQR